MSDRDWGAKTGGGGVASKEATDISRRDRLRQLALESVDLKNDPYLMKNHLGSFECRLCLTLHSNEGNYLAHTQGRRHQTNMARRAAREARNNKDGNTLSLAATQASRKPVPARRTLKIGRPGYRITKQRDPLNAQLSLLFQVDYPEISGGLQPRHRFMSSFEQKKETPDRAFQYLLIAADPYETIAFKIPNRKIDKAAGKFYTHWEADKLRFILQFHYEAPAKENVRTAT